MYLRVKSTLNTITTVYHDPMFTGFYKLLIKKNLPLHVIEFPMAMRKKVSTGTFPTEVLHSKSLKLSGSLKTMTA
jgi:hypothetical protein